MTRAITSETQYKQVHKYVLAADIHCITGDAHLLDNPPSGKRPIGVFDSGMGGLSVLRHLQTAMPHEQFIYLADTKHVPYGERSHEQIEQLTHAAVSWLYDQGCQLVVIACNSASTHSLPSLRAYYGETLPIVGLVPALKPAVKHTQTKTVAVLATKATLNGYLLNQVIKDIATPAGVTVLKFSEPTLVPWVEAGMPKDDAAYDKLISIVQNAAQQSADYLVLGCTHYPFFKEKIVQIAPHLNVIDSGAAIAKRVCSLLHHGEMLQINNNIDADDLYKKRIKALIFTTGNMSDDKSKINKLLG